MGEALIDLRDETAQLGVDEFVEAGVTARDIGHNLSHGTGDHPQLV